MLAGLADGIGDAWRDPFGVRELAGQVSAVVSHLARYPGALAEEALSDLLGVRLRSVLLLNALGDSAELAVLPAEPQAAGSARGLGTALTATPTPRAGPAHAHP